jgi:hypothetical protein
MRTTAIWMSAIALSALTCANAHAQEGPGGGAGGPAGAGPSIEAPGGGPAGGGPAMDGGGPAGGGPDTGATPTERGGPSDGGPSGGEGPRGAERGPSADEDAAGPPARAADDTPSDRGASRKSERAAERSNADEKPPGRGKSDEKAAERGERAKSKEESAKRGKDDDEVDDSQKRATTEAEDRAKEAREGAKPGEDTAGKKDDAARPGADTARVEPERAKQVELAGEKRDRVETAFRDKGGEVRRQTNVDIDISVGRRLPRHWHFVPVPIAVIDLVPEYRDYVYVWVEDEYVICDPDTYEVVAVIPASSSQRAQARDGGGGGGKCTTRIDLSDDERDLILQSVRVRDAVEVDDLSVGWSVPANIELETFPESVLAEADELSGCRYFVAEDQLAIVDPEEDKVVLLIDRS